MIVVSGKRVLRALHEVDGHGILDQERSPREPLAMQASPLQPGRIADRVQHATTICLVATMPILGWFLDYTQAAGRWACRTLFVVELSPIVGRIRARERI